MKKIILFIANRLWLIFVIYISSILVSAWLFSYFENKPYGDGLWWSVVTALTIGYGYLSPTSIPGRIIGVIFGHFWIFGIIPLIIGNIVCRVLEDKNKFTHQEQEWQETALKKIAQAVSAHLPDAPTDY